MFLRYHTDVRPKKKERNRINKKGKKGKEGQFSLISLLNHPVNFLRVKLLPFKIIANWLYFTVTVYILFQLKYVNISPKLTLDQI